MLRQLAGGCTRYGDATLLRYYRSTMTTDNHVVKLLKGWRFLYRRGFIEGFGHLSFRLDDADRFVIVRHSVGAHATADDLVLMDLDGRKLDGRGDPPGEYPIHSEIYKSRADVMSVVHYHGMYSTAFTTIAQKLRPIHSVGTIFHEGVPIYPDPKLILNRERGAALARTLGSHRAVLLRAHGAAITGPSIEDTVSAAFLFEENAHRASVCATLGRPRWLDKKTAREAGEELLRNRGPFRRVWALVESETET
jgi:ribulose-5-phosphate 4-epimerase/fuculose-1-phosphate aldolase